MNGQKVQPPRKMFPQTRKNSWKISKLKRKKSVRQKEKALTNRFSYSLRTPKPMDKKIQKFLSHPSSGGNCKTSGEKKVEEKSQKAMKFELKVRQAKCGFFKVSLFSLVGFFVLPRTDFIKAKFKMKVVQLHQ